MRSKTKRDIMDSCTDITAAGDSLNAVVRRIGTELESNDRLSDEVRELLIDVYERVMIAASDVIDASDAIEDALGSVQEEINVY